MCLLKATNVQIFRRSPRIIARSTFLFASFLFRREYVRAFVMQIRQDKKSYDSIIKYRASRFVNQGV